MRSEWSREGRAARLALAASLVVLAAGCASFSEDGGLGTVRDVVRERSGKDIAWARADDERRALDERVAELLAKKPLGVEEAVQVALYNNRGLQAAFHELGALEADLVQAGRLPNPRFTMLRASRQADVGREYKIELALTANIFALATMPLALEVERRRFYAGQRALALEVLAVASSTRKAYYAAVAAKETVRYQREVERLAQASAELARRMARAGNWNKLQQAREQGFYADAALNLARAEQAQIAARERLVRLLGVWGMQTRFELPERLPDLPAAVDDLPDVERDAIANRLDIQAARADTEALARNLGLTKVTRFLSVIELGPARVHEGQMPPAWKRGFEIGFEIPIFDWGGAKVARAESIYMQAVNRTAEIAVNARSEVREAYHGYRSGYDVARHYRDEIVPLRKRIADENLLRYNGMLIGVFELLADARTQIASVNAYIESLRDFWLAKADLDMAMIGTPVAMSMSKSAPAAGEGGGGH
jgi:outer membrane protein TolC